jgi:hypothetical protein
VAVQIVIYWNEQFKSLDVIPFRFVSLNSSGYFKTSTPPSRAQRSEVVRCA